MNCNNFTIRYECGWCCCKSQDWNCRFSSFLFYCLVSFSRYLSFCLCCRFSFVNAGKFLLSYYCEAKLELSQIWDCDGQTHGHTLKVRNSYVFLFFHLNTITHFSFHNFIDWLGYICSICKATHLLYLCIHTRSLLDLWLTFASSD